MDKIENHNSFYVEEGLREQPKEFFKFLAELAEPQLSTASTLLDVGCACGEFLCYLQSLHPGLSLAGMDVSPEFVVEAKRRIPDGRFSVGDIYGGNGLPKERFDVVFMNGVNYLFPQYEPWLRHLLSVTKRNAFVYGLFNSEGPRHPCHGATSRR